MSQQSEQQSQQPAERSKPPPYVPSKKPRTTFPLIDNDPHIKRVITYARPSDYGYFAAVAAIPPALITYWEHISPTHMGKGGLAPMMRLNVAFGLIGGFIFAYNRSAFRFYGITENTREVAMDMREMVDKVKRNEPLYGKTELSDYMQGVAARNSRYTAVFTHVMPVFNFVNHNQHGVDTAKYYRQAERELEEERVAREGR